jgi:flagellar biosynthesis protein FliR
MGDLTISQIIKLIIGVLVLVAVVAAITIAFRNYIIPYFEAVSALCLFWRKRR